MRKRYVPPTGFAKKKKCIKKTAAKEKKIADNDFITKNYFSDIWAVN